MSLASVLSVDECQSSDLGHFTEWVRGPIFYVCTHCSSERSCWNSGRQCWHTCTILIFIWLLHSSVVCWVRLDFLSPSNVCACLVVAWSRRIYVTSATPLITCHTKADPLSEMIVLGKQACLVMIVFRTLSNFLAFQIRVRKANNFLKNSSIVLTMYSLPPDGGSSEIRSTCTASFSPVTWSLVICCGGRMNLLSNFDSLTHCSHDMIHFLTNFAVFGYIFYVCTQLLFWWFRSSSFTR